MKDAPQVHDLGRAADLAPSDTVDQAAGFSVDVGACADERAWAFSDSCLCVSEVSPIWLTLWISSKVTSSVPEDALTLATMFIGSPVCSWGQSSSKELKSSRFGTSQ